MTKIETRPLPHKIGNADIANAELKRVAMLLMENFMVIKRQIEVLQAAVMELQKGG